MFAEAIEKGLTLYESEGELEQLAIAFSGQYHTSFQQIQELAALLIMGSGQE